MGRQLVDERSSRVRSEERAEMAAHLHDSVLQTLALIQRSKAEREMVSLARTQERELRAWLYGRAPELAGVRLARRDRLDGGADRAPAPGQRRGRRRRGRRDGRASSRPRQRVRRGGGERGRPLRAAPRSACTSRSRRTQVTAFVRDQGSGFDPAVVPADRRGIADSIVGRMERHGGTATVHSRPGAGTEVVLKLPRRTS